MPKRLAGSGDGEMPAPEVNVTELGRLIRAKRGGELSMRQAAAQARVSVSTLSRIEDGAQPDLATFMSLCAWLGVEPARFFSPTTLRSQTPLETALEHITTDPALSPDSARRIASVVREMYTALAAPQKAADAYSDATPLAVHLRAATVMRPGVPDRLASLLRHMRDALEHADPA